MPRLGPARRLVFAAAVALAAGLFPLQHWVRPPHWSPDGLFYESQRLEVGGVPAQQARRRVFFSDPRYRQARDDAFPPSAPTRAALLNRRWVEYSARFYRRRWTVPLVAAAVSPLFGIRSILLVSIAGYVAIGLLLYAWLRLRFAPTASAATAIAALALPPLREWSFSPLTDSWGIVLLLAALYAAYRALAGRERRWEAAFVASMLVGAFTRDTGLVVIVALAVVGLVYRRRGALRLAAAGAVATLPAILAFGAPAVAQLAYILDGFRPAPGGWGFVAHRYPRGALDWLSSDATYLRDHLGTALFLLGGLLVVALRSRTRDAYLELSCGALIGSAAFLLIVLNPLGTAFRLELVALPAAAVGVASVFEAAARATSPRNRLT